MARKTLEEIKAESNYLRGRIIEDLADEEKSHFEEEEYQLLKFHGSYQQDDRDVRTERRRQKLDKAWMMMVRTKCPGGDMTAEHYLAHDRISDDIGNGTIRITSREGFQMHGILKHDLKECIRRINEAGLTTRGACGDVSRNTLAPSSPIADAVHRDAQALARRISDALLWKSTAYAAIWLNGDKIDVPEWEIENEIEPLYGQVYMPRKFKVAIAIPPRNDVDIYSNDVAIIPHAPNGEVEGYTVAVGGGFGMSHGKEHTFPRLADHFCYVAKEHILDLVIAILKVQRDHGRRDDRSQARMKYLINDKGLEWFGEEVRKRLDPGIVLHPPKNVEWKTVSDMLGWHEQGDGKLFVCVFVPDGRIKDFENGEGRFKSAFRKIATELKFPMRVTANTNLIFFDIDPSQKDAVQAILDEHGIAMPDKITTARGLSQACVALPTCGLALTDSERVFQGVLDKIDEILREHGLDREEILIRMTGCPNGCARPYNADIGFVGRAPGKYAVFAGGHVAGTRLARMQMKMADIEELPEVVRPWIEDFAKNRLDGETFSDFWGRTRPAEGPVDPRQFHVETAELEEAK